MEYNIDLEFYGTTLRDIRQNCQYTRKAVEELSGISSETLRRIEKGDYYPQFATLELLSKLYKVDLIALLVGSKSTSAIEVIYSALNNLFVTGSPEDLDDLHEIKALINYELNQNPKNEIKQLMKLMEAILLSIEGCPQKKAEAIDLVYETLYTFSTLKVAKDFSTKNLNRIECHLVFLLSVNLSDLGKVTESNALLENIIRVLEYPLFPNQYFLYIKATSNLAYNYHILDEHKKIITLLEKAITTARKQHSSYLLYFLYYRLAVAYFHEDIRELALKNFSSAALHLKTMQSTELYEQYKHITLTKYQIDF